ncbi:MAG: pilus assembly protein PilM [Nitrospirales bacterium]|nr:pilus assembly protein PilM [Nitrospirales bacterium]
MRGLSASLMRRAGLSIGVDLGSHLHKFVVLKRKGDRYILKDWGAEPVSPLLDPAAIHLTGICSHKLMQWLKKRTWPSNVGTSVSGPRVIVKRLEFPSMSEEDIREHLRWELDRYISLEMGEVLWDLHIPVFSSLDSSQPTQVLLVVAQKNWLQSVMSSFKGQKIGFVDVDAFALTNLVTINYRAEEPCLLAHIGPSGMLLLVIHKGEVVLYREVPFVVEWYGDLVDQIRFAQPSSTGENPMEISTQILWEPYLEEVSGQIQGIIIDYSASNPSQVLNGVILSGGYTVVEGMGMNLSRRLGLPVRPVDPFHRIEVPPTFRQDPTFVDAVPLLGVAVGVALRGLG